MTEQKQIALQGGETALTPEQIGNVLVQMNQLMRGMADTLRATNERVAQLEAQVKQMVPLSAAQATTLCAVVRNRARELTEQYRLDANGASAIAAAIRRDLKLAAGVRAIGELPRALYSVYVEQVGLWDDYGTMREIKRSHSKGGARNG